jgi:hypothetical protein
MDTRIVKRASTFFAEPVRGRIRRNISRYEWAKETARLLVEAAEPWRRMSDDDLWALMFGPTLPRSWMVWSNGYCPACKQPVPMYDWLIQPWKHPWKVQCPHCKMLFPTNDFEAYYRSGLDEHGVFDPKRADRSLLFNTQHPDPNDPLHRFGVDDGTGYAEGENRWRFIGAYLIYGQWKQLVIAGVLNLASAYLVTGDALYARKAGILLDRIADLYPQFDHKTQSVVYETMQHEGYVSTWHDACEETRLLAIAYDAVFEALRVDGELSQFLSEKAKRFNLPNPKATFADVHQNIEQGLLLDPLRNEHKITSNFPRTPFAKMVLMAVQNYEQNAANVQHMLDETLQKATAVDGVTGEKGLANYSASGVRAIAHIVGLFDRVYPNLLPRAVERFRLRDTFRFHLETWIFGRYYPLIGDTGIIGQQITQYCGVDFLRLPALGTGIFEPHPLFNPSLFTLFWRLYELTGDVDFVRLLYQANGNSLEGLPHDLLAEHPARLQQMVKRVIAQHGTTFSQSSVNKSQWHLAILRSGRGEHERAVWIDYDSGNSHGHHDALNVGMFAFGLDLMVDFGYPPVQYGGWYSDKVLWYYSTAAHNTVVVDGQKQRVEAGKSTLWVPAERVRTVRVCAPEVYGIRQYERTLVMVDVSEKDFYVLDIFRVVGGSTHDKFLHSTFGQINLEEARHNAPTPKEYAGAVMRQFQRIQRRDPNAPLTVDWQVEDRRGYRSSGEKVTLRCIELTPEAEAYTCEGWVSLTGYTGTEQAWIPRLLVRRRDGATLASTFVAVLVPFEGEDCPVAAVRRLPLLASSGDPYADNHVAVEVTLRGGERHLLVAMDVEDPLHRPPSFRKRRRVKVPEWGDLPPAQLLVLQTKGDGRIRNMPLLVPRG